MKILIVDDNADNRGVLAAVIRKHGHEIIEAVDGQDGLEKTLAFMPDLIVTDIMMPRMDGFQFLRNLKNDEGLEAIPCVFYSATYEGNNDRELALSLGADGFIAKPKNPFEVWNEIEGIIKKRKPGANAKKVIAGREEFLEKYSHVLTEKLQVKVKELEEREAMFKTLFESNPDAIVIVNREGHIVQMNKQVETVFGYQRDELLNETIEILIPERFRERHVKYRSGYFAKPSIRAMGCFGLYARRKDKSEFLVDIMLSPLYTDDEMCALCVVRDITERQRIEESLVKSEASLANAQRIAHLGSWEWNIVTNELRWSEEVYRIFGLPPQAFGATYEAFLDSVHPDDREFVKRSVNEALYEKKPYSIDHRIILPDGAERIVHEQAEVIFDATGKATGMFGTVQDITEYKRVENELRKLSIVIEQSINIVFITDVNGNIEYVNPMFEKVTGYSREDAIGQNPRILAAGETPREKYEELWKTLLSGKTWRGLVKNKKKNGQYYWCNCTNFPIVDNNGKITHLLAVQEDITEKIQAEERAKYLVSFDALTGLLNRARFMEVMDEWIYSAKAYNYIGALLLVDIDKFRHINDTYGNLAGDDLLKRLAWVLRDTLSDIDTQYYKTAGKEKQIMESIIGRLSGDEYAIFLPSRSEEEAVATAEKIRKKIEAIWFEGISGHVTLCIGITIFPKHGVVVHDLFSKADAAVYHAKEVGQNRTHLYQTKDLVLEKMRSRMKGKVRIQKALEEDRFVPWFQPILDLGDDTVHHYEALARIRDVDDGIILPSAFIDTAETFGLVTAIDRVIIEKTLKLQSQIDKQGTFFSFSMNLSGKDIGNEELLEFLRYKTTEIGVDPNRLIFEITETAAIRELNNAVAFIHNLRSIGCRFSLDDFGVGFASFRYLKEMEVDYIKIDGSFIRNLPENKSDRLFVKAMTDVAKGMGIKTVAEFVENKETVDILKEYGVDYAQGYYIGKPALGII